MMLMKQLPQAWRDWREAMPSRKCAAALVAAVLVSPAPAWSQKSSIRFAVVNETTDEIKAVHVCPTGASKWGPNLLPPQTVLAPGKRLNLRIAGDCGSYDIRLVAPAGREYMEEEMSFCEDDDVVTIGRGELKRVKREDAGGEQ